MSAGLAALMGLLKGVGDLPEGIAVGERQRLAQEQLDEAKRHTAVMEDQANLDVSPENAAMLGVQPGRQRKDLLAILAPAMKDKRAAEAEAAATDQMASGIAALKPIISEGPVAEGQYGPGSPVSSPNPDMAALAKLVKGLGRAHAGPVVTKLVEQMGLDGSELGVPHIQQEGTQNVITGKKSGKILGVEPTGLERLPGQGRSAQIDVQRERLAAEYELGKFKYAPGTPQFKEELGRRTEIFVPVAPGGESYRKSDLSGAESGASTARPTVKRLPIPTAEETKEAGQRSSIIDQLEAAAKVGDKMEQLKSTMGRGSLRIRSWLQGHTPYEALNPQEQEWVTTHDNLRIFYEQARMGLGPFRSPEMQNILQEIIGRYWTPGTGDRLRTLSKMLREEQAHIGAAQSTGGRTDINTPLNRQPKATKRFNQATGRIEVIQ